MVDLFKKISSGMPGNCLGLIMIICLLFPAGVGSKEKKPVQIAPGEIEFAESLKIRQADLQKREDLLAQHQKEYEALKIEVDGKLVSLTELQDKIQRKLDELTVVKDKQFKNLVKVYSAMSVSKVAPLLNKMDDDTVVMILRSMKSDTVAKLLPKFDQEKAVRVSKQLGLIE
ncbi:MAG: hypothetical protein KKE17_11070 [Proteobacteria bacterium]|nr:hypothetical protein [Pseudomonadota bacterium]MBU1710534.1 hypothetical protein [Pseudomonadota bacterium]